MAHHSLPRSSLDQTTRMPCLQVHKGSEAMRLDQRRLVLQLDAQHAML